MKLATHNSYELWVCMMYFLISPVMGFNSYAPFSEFLYIHKEKVFVSNYFHSFLGLP